MAAKTLAPKAPQTDAGDALLQKYELADENDPVETFAKTPVVETPPAKVAEPPNNQNDNSVPEPAIKHPNWVVKQAQKLGVTQQEIDSTPTDELKDQLLFAANQRERIEHDNPGRPRDENGRFVSAPPEPSAPAPEPEFSLSSLGIDPAWLNNPETPTEALLTGVLKPVVKQNNDLAKKIEKLQGEIAALYQAEQHRVMNKQFDELDTMFVSQDTIFGKGNRKKMDQNSDEFSRRMAVINEMGRIKQADQKGDSADHFALACKRLFYTAPSSEAVSPAATPKPVAPATKPTSDPLGFAEGKLQRPSSLQSPPPKKGDAAALDHIREWRANMVGAPSSQNGIGDDEESLSE